MSSTYRILCLSHDPATEWGEYGSPEAAEAALAEGLPEHPACHLMIGRYSSPLVEVGCPPSRVQPAKLRCCHGGTAWVDSEWLRLLSTACQSSDPVVQQAAKDGRHWCHPPAVLARLRNQLGIPQ